MITASLLSTTDLLVALRASIRGDLVTPAEPSFPAATFGVGGRAPELVVVAADVTDVARTIALSGRTGRRVVAQVTGRPTVVTAARTILIVTRLLATVRVDADRQLATVGIGASWRQVLDAAEPFGLTALSGAASVPPAHRPGPYPFAADRIRSFEVVTATGERRRVDANEPDFAALRRGQGTVGLVVGMTLELVRHPLLVAAELIFAAADAPAALAGWRQWAATVSGPIVTASRPGPAAQDHPDHDNHGADDNQAHRQDTDGRSSLTIRVGQLGDPDRAGRRLAALEELIGAAPVARRVGPTTMAALVRGSATRRAGSLAGRGA